MLLRRFFCAVRPSPTTLLAHVDPSGQISIKSDQTYRKKPEKTIAMMNSAGQVAFRKDGDLHEAMQALPKSTAEIPIVKQATKSKKISRDDIAGGFLGLLSAGVIYIYIRRELNMTETRIEQSINDTTNVLNNTESQKNENKVKKTISEEHAAENGLSLEDELADAAARRWNDSVRGFQQWVFAFYSQATTHSSTTAA